VELYHVVTDKSNAEIYALSAVKPDNQLGSYYYFRTKNLKNYFQKLGYTPKNFMLDSGAFSAWNKGKNISIIDYMNYIKANEQCISYYIALDVIGDSDLTFDYFRIMKKKGFKPIPVFHYGANLDWLKSYVDDGCDYIALGATVPIKNKTVVAKWVISLQVLYPNVKYHLLGCSSTKVTHLTDLYSADSSTWITQAKNGNPKHIEGKTTEKKIERAIYNLKHANPKSQYKQLNFF